MFTLLPRDCINEFLNKYPIFRDYQNDLLFYDNHYIFPLSFYDNYYIEGMKQWKTKESINKIDINYTGKLREVQKPIVDKLNNHYEKNGNYGGVLVASCGFGKTYVSVYLSTILKRKTIIIVDQITKSKTENILENEEWYKALIATTDLKDDDIGKFFGGMEELDKPVVLATVQTILSKIKNNFEETYNKLKSFDFVIYDESHASGSTINYSKSRLAFSTNNVLAVTATPPRNKINDILFKNSFGDIICEFKNYKDNPPEVRFVCFDSKLEEDFDKFDRLPYDFKRYVFHDRSITKSKKYLSIIHNLNKLILKDENRKVINIVKTTNEKNINSQASKLMKILKKFNPTKKYGNYSDINDDDRCIVAGYKKAHKKFSYDSLTDIIITFQTSNNFNSIEQMIGRVLRILPNKPVPRVWFIVDTGFQGYFKKNINKIKPILYELYGDIDVGVIEDRNHNRL